MTIPALVSAYASSVSSAADRVVAMEKIAISGSQAEKYPGFEYDFNNLYWRNSLGPHTPAPQAVSEFRIDVPILASLVAGNITQGYEGTLEKLILWTYVPTVVGYFTNCRNLVYQSGQTPLRFWADQGLTIAFQRLAPTKISDDESVWEALFLITLPFLVPLNRSLT